MAFVVLGSGMLLGEVNSIRIGPNPLADYKQHKAHGHTTSDCLWGIELRRRRRMQGRDASELVSILEKPERCISVLS